MVVGLIDFRKLRYFVAVIEHGSFSRAADALHVTQPALSTAVKKLEEHFDLPLLDREVKPFALTTYGETVYRSAKTLYAENKRLHRELRDVEDLNNGAVTIILGATFPINYVLDTYEEVRKSFPGFSLGVEIRGYTNSLEALLKRECDLIFSQLPANRADSRVLHREILRDHFRVICSSAHPLAAVPQPSLADLTKFSWIGGGPFDAFLSGWSRRFQTQGLKPPRASINTLTITITKMALQKNDYLAMLPMESVDTELRSGELVALAVPEFQWKQIKGVSWSAERSMPPSVEFFLKTFDEVVLNR